MVFDYKTISKKLKVPTRVLGKFEQEASSEFPGDDMLRELHVLRALKAYARAK